MKTLNIEELIREMTPEEKAQMVSGRDFWKTQDNERLGIPSVMMCDGPNGLRKQIGKGDHLGINASIETVCYPTASAMAASFDRKLLYRQGEILGAECRAEKVGMLLGPGVNMKRSPLCGRNFEYYSEDPYLAGQMAAAYIQGLQSTGTASCVKHFAGNNQETRRMSGSSQIDERTLHEIYLPAFEAAVKEGGVKSVMCAYNAVNGTFCSENGLLLHDILRGKWGFEGFVVTDWGAVKDRVKGLAAGLDLEMPGAPVGKTQGILKALESGELDEAKLDEAVRNILKFVSNAMECVSGLPVSYVPGYDTNETDPDSKAACALREEAMAAAQEADAVVIFAGLPEAYESEGVDRTSLKMPANQNRLIEAVSNVSRKTIVVLHEGSPVVLPWKDQADAILCMYLGGDQVGAATVRLLYGEVCPSGKLAETWPLKLEDNPSYLNFPGEDGTAEYHETVFIGYRYYDKKAMEVLFPFGHGLSYTTFVYSGLTVAAGPLTETDSVTVSCTVTNTGSCAGKESVQLYAGMKQSAVRRPVRELKGFEKVFLQPGESKQVTFTLDIRTFAYYEPRIHDWFLESGEGIVEIGSSSRDIRLRGSVRIVSSMELPVTVTRETAIGDLVKTAKGRAFVASFTKKLGMDQNPQASEAAEAMGEGSAAIMVQMMYETPLGSLVSYGVMNDEALDHLIAGLNE